MKTEFIAIGVLIAVCAVTSFKIYSGYIQYLNDYDDTHV